MRSSDSPRQPLVWLGAVVAVVLVAAGVLLLTVLSRNVVVAAELSVTTSTSLASTSTTTSTSTTVKPTTTSTTVKPTTTSPPTTRPTTTRPAAVVATAAPRPTTAPLVALPGNSTHAERCANARQWVVDHGLSLPAGWGFRCPGTATVAGAEKWGVACWNCEGTGSWIAVDIARIGSSDKALRYVIAHETCHAMDYVQLGLTTELGADLCAATHGAPR